MSSKTNEIKGSPADVVFDENLNISRARSLSERGNEVIQRAIDIFDNGQTQPVRCFPGKGGKPTCYIGWTRGAAVELIRRGFSVPTGEVHLVAETDPEGKPTGKEIEQQVTRTIKDENFPLVYVVDDIDEATAVVRGAADNYQSFSPNDLDLARTAKALQDKYEYTDAKVTQLLGISDPYKIGRIKKLLNAPAVIQDAVATGKLATAAALEVLAATGDARKAAVAAVKEAVEAGKRAPTQSKIKSIVQEQADRQARVEAGKNPEPPVSRSAPTAPEIRAFFKDWPSWVDTNGGQDAEAVLLVDVLKDMNKYLAGTITEKTLVAKFDEHFSVFSTTRHGKPAKVAEKAEEKPAAEEAPKAKRTGKGAAAARKQAREAAAAQGGEGAPAATEKAPVEQGASS